MLCLGTLVIALTEAHISPDTALATLVRFVQTVSSLRPLILHRLPSSWNPNNVPLEIAPYIRRFIGCRLGVSESSVEGLWRAVGMWVWTHGTSLLSTDGDETFQGEWDGSDAGAYICM